MQVYNHYTSVGGKWPTIDLRSGGSWHWYMTPRERHCVIFATVNSSKLWRTLGGLWRIIAYSVAGGAPAAAGGHARSPLQHWDFREMNRGDKPQMKKFEGYIDEMRFSDETLYKANFTPPASLAAPS